LKSENRTDWQHCVRSDNSEHSLYFFNGVASYNNISQGQGCCNSISCNNFIISTNAKGFCLVLYQFVVFINTIQYSPQSARLYLTGGSFSPPHSSTQTASRSLQPFMQSSLGDRPTDRLTDHVIRSITIDGIYVHSTEMY